MNAEQHEWYWRGYNDAKEVIQSGQMRVWFGLTDDERIDLMYESGGNEIVAIQITEAKLKEKNSA